MFLIGNVLLEDFLVHNIQKKIVHDGVVLEKMIQCANACWWQVVCEVGRQLNPEWYQRCNVPSTYSDCNNWINFTHTGRDQGEKRKKVREKENITSTTKLLQTPLILLLLSEKQHYTKYTYTHHTVNAPCMLLLCSFCL